MRWGGFDSWMFGFVCDGVGLLLQWDSRGCGGEECCSGGGFLLHIEPQVYITAR